MAMVKLEVQDIETINVSIKGYGSYEVPRGISAASLIKRILSQPKYTVVGIILNNHLKDLHHTLEDSCQIELVDLTTEAGVRIYRRTAAYMLIKACRELFPQRKLKVKHTLSNGLFCEFLGDQTNDEELDKIEKKMRQYAALNLPVNKMAVPKNAARNIFAVQGQEDKVKLLEFREKDCVHIYELDGFYEYFYGYMLPEVGKVDKFKLINYPLGMILQTPGIESPGIIKPYIEQKNLASIFREAEDWAEMLKTPHVASLNDIIKSGDIKDIIMINEALHEKKVASIADQICSNPKIRLILVSGPSSSGKTTFSERLLIQLRVNGRKPVSVSLDNYFVDREVTPLDENNEYNYEVLEALKVELLNEHLLKLINGEEVKIPTYSFHDGRCIGEGVPLTVPDNEPIIIEGIHGLNDDLTWSIPRDQKFKIYVSALTQLNIDYSNRIPTTDSRLIRRIIRDSRTRGYSALDTIRRWPSVRTGEDKNIFPFQESADVMFNSSLVYELSVMKNFAQPLLEEIQTQHREHIEAKRLLKFLTYFRPVSANEVPANSILREFIGGSCFKH